MNNSNLSSEELFLLSKFQKWREPEEFQTEFWRSIIQKPVDKLIEGLFSNGILEKADLEAILGHKCTVADLKEMLKQKNLKQTGKKEELIARLLNCSMDELLRKYAVVKLYRCSEAGNRLVKEFVEKENRKREENERVVINALENGEFKEAIREVVKFEASQIIPRGMGIDWQNYKLEKVDLEILTVIFKSRPKILTDIGDDELEILKIGAAMMHLYGASDIEKWLPPDFQTKSRFDNNTAGRMLLFHATFIREKNEIATALKSGDVHIRYIEIIASDDACVECKAVSQKKFKLKNIPELPYEKCTCDLGCRCSISPVFN